MQDRFGSHIGPNLSLYFGRRGRLLGGLRDERSGDKKWTGVLYKTTSRGGLISDAAAEKTLTSQGTVSASGMESSPTGHISDAHDWPKVSRYNVVYDLYVKLSNNSVQQCVMSNVRRFWARKVWHFILGMW